MRLFLIFGSMEYYKKPLYKLALFLILLVLAFVATYAYWIKFSRISTGIDDANIYFIYMRNLANGDGFVYNPGGEHVEGFTSFLWVLIGSVFFLFTSKPETSLICLNVVFMALSIWRVCLLADTYFKDKRLISPYTIIICGFILLIPGYVCWMTFTIMETGLWSLLLVFIFCGIVERTVRNKRGFGNLVYLLPLLVLTRPESYLWAFVGIGLHFLLNSIYHKKEIRQTVLGTTILAGIVIGTIGILTALRLWYFGYPFPNTYYAKVSADTYANLKEGIIYMQKFFYLYTPHLNLPVVATIISIIAVILKKKRSVALFVFPVVIGICYAIPLYTGGDHFALFRFIQPFIPLMVLFYVLSFFTLLPLKNAFWYVPAFGSLVLIFYSCRLNYYNFDKKTNLLVEFHIAIAERDFSNQLNEFFQYQKPYPTYGVMVAGASAYVYKGYSIDLLGLNNVEMGHSTPIKTGFKNHGSFNKDVFLKQRPDLFFYTRVYNDTSEFNMKEQMDFKEAQWNRDMFKDIFKDDNFKKIYFPVFIFSNKDSGVVQTHTTQDFLNRLDTNVYRYYKIPIPY